MILEYIDLEVDSPFWPKAIIPSNKNIIIQNI